MPDRIFVTFTPTTAPESYHAAIHYERTDAAGKVIQHLVIEAKPERYGQLSPLDNVFGVIEENFREGNSASRFGTIQATVHEPNSKDENAPYEIIAEGADLSSSFAKMLLFASGVNTAGFAYRGDHQNSNSFASATLKAGELPPATGVAHDPAGRPGELLEFFAPGLNEPLRAPLGKSSSYAPAGGNQYSSPPRPNSPASRDPQLSNDAALDRGSRPRPDATGSLYFGSQSSPRQFGPFTLPGSGRSGTDISEPRNSSPGNSSIPAYSTPGRFGDGSAGLQPLNGNASNQADGNDVGGVWTTAQQTMGGQAGRFQPAIVPPNYAVPDTFPENGTQPIGYLNGANRIGTFDPAASATPLPRPRSPQVPAASWPSAPIAPLLQMPQAEPTAPWQPDWHDAGDWPQEGLPSWVRTQPPAENTFPASANGVRGMAGSRSLASQPTAPQPAPIVENLTTHVLRMRGVPDADISATINDPRKMQGLLNQLYGRRSMIASGDGSGGFGHTFGQATSADPPDQASTPTGPTPDAYLPFGWAGLPRPLR